jgi:thiosulfate reductase cytochrome b subunit
VCKDGRKGNYLGCLKERAIHFILGFLLVLCLFVWVGVDNLIVTTLGEGGFEHWFSS